MEKQTGITPLNGYSLVEPYEEKKQGGFQTPDSAKEKEANVKGKVIAINQNPYVSEYGGVISCPEISVGDVIAFKQWGFQEVIHGGIKYKLVRHIDVVATINNE